MIEYYQHQKDIIAMNPMRRGLGYGCGAGKTRTVLGLAKGKGDILVVAPKTQVLDDTWGKEQRKMGITLPMKILSKEQFKKGAPKANVLVLDEAHCFLGVTAATRQRKKIEIPKTSQLWECVMAYVAEHKPQYIYLASATPFPSPMALWASAKICGYDWDYFAFRRKFYVFVPKIGRGVWVPRRDAETLVALVVLAKTFWSFGRLEDFFDVPAQVHKTIDVGETTKQKAAKKELRLEFPEPVVRIGKWHQAEQGILKDRILEQNKLGEIEELAKEFPKLLVFCKYTKQLDFYAFALSKTKHTVLVLDGRTKDRKKLLAEAEEPDTKVIVLAQSQVSTGYELPSFRCTIFASMSYSFVDFEQALGRTQRANAISKNVYVYLLAGVVDKAVLACVQNKKDFSEKLFDKST